MKTVEEILHEYLRVLEQHGSVAPKVIIGQEPPADWDSVKVPPEVTAFDDLKTYFMVINGDDPRVCSELDAFDPPLAWDMHPMSLEESLNHHEMAGENPDYWPGGFLPILMDGAGYYVVVNCLAASPTFRAVYDMCDGVGCTRIANSLSEFFAASTREVLLGLRKYSHDESQTIGSREYLDKAAPLFGNSAYFSRRRMDLPVVDWIPGVAPTPYERRTTASVAPPPAIPEIVRWAGVAGVASPIETDSYRIRLSTAPVEQWFFQQSKLSPQTTDIEATIYRDRWNVKLTRKDDLYLVSWSLGGKMSVSSNQLKYQRLIRWPALDSIEDFPMLVKKIESLLGFQFIPYADVTGSNHEQLLAWLSPCAKKVGRYIR